MDYFDLIVDGPFQNVQQMLQNFFYHNGFRIIWHNPYYGIAERGSKGLNVVGGALAQYYEIQFQLIVMPDQSICVRLFKGNFGALGGVIGIAMVEKQYQEIIDNLSYYFSTVV